MQTKTKIGLGIAAVAIVAVVALSSNTKLFRGALVPGVPRDDLPGACVLMTAGRLAPVPSISEPDLGINYARLFKHGVNTAEGLRAACSMEDYNALRSTMCKLNRLNLFEPYVITHDPVGNGTVYYSTLAFYRSAFWPCPPVEGGLPDLEPSEMFIRSGIDWTRYLLVPGAVDFYIGNSRNIGNTPAGASTARLCVDSTSGAVGCRTSGEGQIGELANIRSLNEGEYFYGRYFVGTPTFSGVPGTTHKAYFCLNAPSSITESNTDNNCTAQTFTISE